MRICFVADSGILHRLLSLVKRLQNRPQFQAVLAGAIVSKTEHFVLHRSEFGARNMSLLFPIQDVWLGAMVPKRWARRAVTRNAIKRQIYIMGADFAKQVPDAAWLVRLRREFSRKHFPSAVSVLLKEAVRAELFALMEAVRSRESAAA